MPRREFLAALSAATAAGVFPATAANDLPSNADELALYREPYENWSRELRFKNLLAFSPRGPEDVVNAANWCADNGHQLRPRGAAHGWSPLTLAFSTTARTPVLLAETRTWLNRMELLPGAAPAVRVETGATLDDLQALLEAAGFGFTATPAVGNITVGGALAIDAHGASVPAVGESRGVGTTYGSMSNRILALTAVVWSESLRRYVLRRFKRSDAEILPLMTHLGRAFITEVTLAVEANQNLLCLSYINIPAEEMFASPDSGAQRTLASFLDASGRVEAILYPFTRCPWLKVWTPTPQKPRSARAVSKPYNYAFMDRLPKPVVDLAQRLVTGLPELAPLFGKVSFDATAAGLLATDALALWGPSKNTLFYVRPTTVRGHEAAFSVVTRRSEVQRVVADFHTLFIGMRDRYRASNQFPVNLPIEIRITGLDHPEEFGFDATQIPQLATTAPVASRPDWDVCVWLSTLTLPGTPGMYLFFRELERALRQRYDGRDGLLRPEWSKGWAYTATAGWQDEETLLSVFPAAYGSGWNEALASLRAFDPKGIYSNDFLRLMTGG